MTDNFRGDNANLIASIKALLELDAEGALVPHGVGGHARALLSAAASRLAAGASEVQADAIYQARSITDKLDQWFDCSKDAHDHMAKYPACFETRIVFAAIAKEKKP